MALGPVQSPPIFPAQSFWVIIQDTGTSLSLELGLAQWGVTDRQGPGRTRVRQSWGAVEGAGGCQHLTPRACSTLLRKVRGQEKDSNHPDLAAPSQVRAGKDIFSFHRLWEGGEAWLSLPRPGPAAGVASAGNSPVLALARLNHHCPEPCRAELI